MNSSDLEAFVLVVEKEGYTLAAKSLGISSSTLSRRITSLEKQLQSKLLIRDSHRVNMTAAGKVLYSSAQNIISEVKHLKYTLDQNNDSLAGKLTVLSSLGMAKISSSTIAAMAKQDHQLEVEWVLSEGRQHEMARINFDVMLHIDYPQDTSLVGKLVGQLELDYYATPEYLTKNGKVAEPTDLSRFNLIYSSVNNHLPKVWTIQHNQQSFQVDIAPRFVTGNPEVSLEFVLQHLGIARLPKFLAKEYEAKGIISKAFIQPQKFSFPIYAIYPCRKFLPKRTQLFIDSITDVLSKMD
ncbi:LysR family transcriptional regulator [Vibrio kyushuensis]|uniref:LysR family transcriptional regulator n=1 Tax=Vibrio kyushuensis TaxID=2910249 RepID=UPI003D10E917